MVRKASKCGRFMSARKLGIPRDLKESLIWFVFSVEKGTIGSGKKLFDMRTVMEEGHCGAVACIGGWCAVRSIGLSWRRRGYTDDMSRISRRFCNWTARCPAIYRLFYATDYPMSWVTAEIAAATTRLYLETGVVDYQKAAVSLREANCS